MLEAKLVSKAHSHHRTVVHLSDQVAIGGNELVVIGGPCSVESAEQMEQVANHLSSVPVHAIRGGVYKPRTSPYSFRGWALMDCKFWLMYATVIACLL